MSVLGGVILGTATSATPLLYAALGETVAQRSGVVNVGLEGILLTGAFTATVVTMQSGQPLLGLGAAALTGLLLALLFSLFAIRLTANQVVVGVVLNLFALGLTGTLYRTLFGVTGSNLVTKTLPQLHGTPLPILTPFVLLATVLVWWWLTKTRNGLELRACGEQPAAADSAGISVANARTLALLFGGVMAGIGGAFLSIGDSNTFVPNMSAGRGFIALAIVTAGRWNPWGCLAAALIFGFTDAIQFQGQALGLDTLYRHIISGMHLTHLAQRLNVEHLPYYLFLSLPYVATLIILMAGSRGTIAPAALGRPYRKA